MGVTVSWVPLAADSRVSRGRRAGAFWGTGIGYLIPDALLLALGAVILLTREVGDAAALPAAVAAGGIVALLTLIVLTVAETDEAFANAYSGAMSLQNLFPAGAATPSHRGPDDGRTNRRHRGVDARADELPVLPLPARILLRTALRGAARRLAPVEGCAYGPDDVFGAPAWRAGMLAAWLVGFRDVPVPFAHRAGVVGGPRCSG